MQELFVKIKGMCIRAVRDARYLKGRTTSNDDADGRIARETVCKTAEIILFGWRG
jgi:hypothetical protein